MPPAAAATAAGSGGRGRRQQPRPVEPVDALMRWRPPPHEHAYDERDVLLYHAGLGLSTTSASTTTSSSPSTTTSTTSPSSSSTTTTSADFKFLYECADGFAPLPTFAILPAHLLAMVVPLGRFIPNYDPARALHGEQYLELFPPAPPGAPPDGEGGGGGGAGGGGGDEGSGSSTTTTTSTSSSSATLPTAATVLTTARVVDARPKGGAGAVAVLRTESRDAASGRLLAVNEFTTFVVGAGPFEGARAPLPRPAAATAANAPPPRPPDATARVATSPDQAAIYRLSGDLNPLHIDPSVSARAGYPKPILHGLCTLGLSVRRVLAAFSARDDPGAVRSVKARFAGHVFPGEALRVDMWRLRPGDDGYGGGGSGDGDVVVFETRVEERPEKAAIGAAAVVFRPGATTEAAATTRQQQQQRAKL